MLLQDELDELFIGERAHLIERQEKVRRIFALCEMPVEAKLLLYFLGQHNHTVCFFGERPFISLVDFVEPHLYGCNLHIYPQCNVSKPRAKPGQIVAYYVDFLFEIVYWNHELGAHQVLGRLIVELDGEEDEEHEPERMTRNLSRDRQVSLAGLPLLRFSEAEVFSNVGDVWVEIQGHLSAMTFDALRGYGEHEGFSYRNLPHS